jgi:hypothetical protein
MSASVEMTAHEKGIWVVYRGWYLDTDVMGATLY